MWKKYKKCKNKIYTKYKKIKGDKNKGDRRGGLMLEFLLQYNGFSRRVHYLHYLPFAIVELRRKSILLQTN